MVYCTILGFVFASGCFAAPSEAPPRSQNVLYQRILAHQLAQCNINFLWLDSRATAE
jgi:hypothetical protein